MRDFTKVSPAIWQSRQFRNLPSDDERYLFFYLLSCPHINSAGCFWLPDGYVLRDMRWSQDRFDKARQSLLDAGLIDYDFDDESVLIEDWFQDNFPMNKSHRKGVLTQLGKVPSEQLREKAFAALVKAEAGKDALKRSDTPSSHGQPEASCSVTDTLLNTAYMKGGGRR